MGFFSELGKRLCNGGMSEGEFNYYDRKSDSELISLVRSQRTGYAKAMFILVKRYGRDEAREMVKRGY